MAILRYTASIDNTITNAFQSDLTTRGTGSNMGYADSLEVFSIYAQADSGSSELSRMLLKFPVTDISSLKVIVIGMMAPTVKTLLEVVDDKSDTVDGTVSTTMALFAPSEFAAPGLGRVKVALFPAASLIVPEFKTNADVLV